VGPTGPSFATYNSLNNTVMSVKGGPTWQHETPNDDNYQGWGWLGVDLSANGGPAQSYIGIWVDL
jgi:hypothetical protein